MSSDDVKRILPGEKTAGILGGMGPYATVDFYRQILDCTPVKKDWEHIRLITVVLLAVIEHIPEPASFLKMLKSKLLPKGKIILTTPHPFFDFVHTIGAKAGIFSKEASKEHQLLLNRKNMELVALNSNLSIDEYNHFLFGTNQLFVLS